MRVSGLSVAPAFRCSNCSWTPTSVAAAQAPASPSSSHPALAGGARQGGHGDLVSHHLRRDFRNGGLSPRQVQDLVTRQVLSRFLRVRQVTARELAHNGRVLSRLAPARRRFVLGLLGIALVLAVVGGVGFVRTHRTQSPDQSRPGPVLLVPGYGGSAGSLAPLARALRAGGRDVTLVELPDQARGDLGQQADSLATTAAAAMLRTGATSLDVVGYSAGGVVARLWVTTGGGGSMVRRLVTLGSPHHGTELARLGTVVSGTCPLACQQLDPGSALLAQLDNQPLPIGLVVLSVWTTLDDVVIPPQSAVIDGVPSPSLQSICPADASRHGDLPRDRVAEKIIVEALGAGALPTWGPRDCARLSS